MYHLTSTNDLQYSLGTKIPIVSDMPFRDVKQTAALPRCCCTNIWEDPTHDHCQSLQLSLAVASAVDTIANDSYGICE